ncbi:MULTISPECIES: glycosyltransferase family 2 protein [unclassified Cryobacterium]|uniref:glycosyltransferase n=1 Tax=unclassified Cryobacterium TaxID=2649013 RepID=UPI002AB3EBA0|nr:MULTISPECIES: glycosyltransferase family 2 protein [unclassified Cryobacterium]MDY7543464.1 glycosyltransferase family 2 protein [Cryobacterium sp. 5B3]
MLTFFVIFILVVGINTLLWTTVGLIRAVAESTRRRSADEPEDPLISADEVAILIAAHDEEQVITATIGSAAGQVPVGHVFVVSDASVDRTADLARASGANVLELEPNRGKAGALVAAIDHFDLARRFPVVVLLDADTVLAPDYLRTGLPCFQDPGIVAVAACASTIADPPPATMMGRFLIAYRERFYVMVQYLLKYGQAARLANVISIVPGFASMYRSQVLGSIDINPPGLAIEDFNMTFEVHARKLGRIAFHPSIARASTQDPDNLHDYTRQLRRWTLGFWQTLRRHGFRLGWFWGALALHVFELVTSSVMMLLFLPLLVVSVGAVIWEATATDPSGIATQLTNAVPPTLILIGVLVPDYLLTVLVVAVTRRPSYLVLGFAFPLVRVVDAAICLATLPQAFLTPSSGRWTSPERRVTVAPELQAKPMPPESPELRETSVPEETSAPRNRPLVPDKTKADAGPRDRPFRGVGTRPVPVDRGGARVARNGKVQLGDLEA